MAGCGKVVIISGSETEHGMNQALTSECIALSILALMCEEIQA